MVIFRLLSIFCLQSVLNLDFTRHCSFCVNGVDTLFDMTSKALGICFDKDIVCSFFLAPFYLSMNKKDHFTRVLARNDKKKI